jgi:5-methylcytosine-specific restriction endonuclease McrA
VTPPRFISRAPTAHDCWRGIVLFGRNVASYKFAFANALLDLRPQPGTLVKLEELAGPYSRHIRDHLRLADEQGTSSSSKFLNACRKCNDGEIAEQQLIETTVQSGFNNVIDAFHVVGPSAVPISFFNDERSGGGGVRITDNFAELIDPTYDASLPAEVEARWRLVETAWQLGVSRGLLRVNYDEPSRRLFAIDGKLRRQPITSCRPALNGYQKGKCFYCSDRIEVLGGESDVDHFFPHVLKQLGHPAVDGVWNLVLACVACNRGGNGKFARVPTIRLLERLYARNEFLIASHHPLRETLIHQTGKTADQRRVFLNDFHNSAWSALIHLWEPTQADVAAFES